MHFSLTSVLVLLPLISASPVLVPRADLTGDTQNDLTDLTAAKCKPVSVIFARGTTESGNVGTVAGPPFFQSLAKSVGAQNLAVQGVPYAADVPGFLAGGDKTGSTAMAKLVTDTLTTCPSTKLVIAGYSQGGQLVHNAAKSLPAASAALVSSAIIFGDPMNGTAVAGVPAAKTKIICHSGDNICKGGDFILAAHLSYGDDAGAAAAFAAAGTKMA